MSVRQRLGFGKDPLYLIDGSAFIYRGFYAYPDLKRADGFPTNALFMVFRLLLKILREEAPGHICFIMDGRGPNFRHELLESYKANRLSMPENLAAQLPPLKQGIELMGVNVLVAEGCEADDCIASLARRYKGERPVVIVGADKDLCQCLDSSVVLWDPSMKKEKLITLDAFTDRESLTPEQWPDFQALVGDKSDNIPGVPGVGPKTALGLLRRYPSLDRLRDSFDQLTAKEQTRLKPHLEDIFIYRELTSLRTDVCQEVSLEDLARGEMNPEELRDFLESFQFRSLIRDLGLGAASVAKEGPAAKGGEARAVSPVREVSALPPLGEEAVGVLPGGRDRFLVGVGREEFLYTGPVGDLVQGVRQCRIFTPSVKDLLGDAAWAEVPLRNWFDLGLAGYLLDPEERDYGFEALMNRFGPELQVDENRHGVAAVHLGKHLEARLQGAGLLELMQDLELPLVPVLRAMERAGIRLDQDAFRIFLDNVQARLDELTESILDQAGQEFNIRSSQQLAEVLFTSLGLTSKRRTPGGAPSTASGVLEEMRGEHPVIDDILEFRMLEKLRSTYLAPLPKLADAGGRIHTTFNQLATATGRLSSSHPNMQNIPIRGRFGPRMRSCFIADPGNVLVAADYSQIELRVLAHMSEDPNLLDAFRNREDIHSRTAALLFDIEPDLVEPDQRRKAKTINFGLLYGMGPLKLSRELSISLNQAKEFIRIYFSKLSRVREFYEQIEERARENGAVTTVAGRRRLLPDINSRNANIAQQARRMAINTVVQGSAADIIKKAMLAVHGDERLRDLGARLILQVHDELIIELPEDSGREAGGRLAELMSGVYDLAVPLSVDWGAGKNWAEAHS
jgi:DNA polymerase-1